NCSDVNHFGTPLYPARFFTSLNTFNSPGLSRMVNDVTTPSPGVAESLMRAMDVLSKTALLRFLSVKGTCAHWYPPTEGVTCQTPVALFTPAGSMTAAKIANEFWPSS